MNKHGITNSTRPDERANVGNKRETEQKASPVRLLVVELLAMS
jgi:hypothetical protein